MKKTILYIVFTMAAFQITTAQNADIRILRTINLNRNTALDPAFRFMSNSVAPIVVAAPISMFGFGLCKKDSALKSEAISVGASVLTAVIISNVLKYSVNRTRPFDKYPDIDDAMGVHSPSFPSGHTSQSFSFATSLSLTYPKWYVIVPSYLWAGTVAYSRMDLGVHYPSDVLIGAVVGSGSAFLCYKLNQKLRK